MCDNNREMHFFGAFLWKRTFCLGDYMNDNVNDIVNKTNVTADQENIELFKQALHEAVFNMEKDIENVEYTPSRRHKIRMNRIFRERVGGKFLPFPEADNAFERIRSKIVVIFKINDILDKKKEKSHIKRKKK